MAPGYGGADFLLRELESAASGASEVRCWPHHFDLATLITLSGSGEEARTVGVGLSPGDDSYREPYYYVTPWPYPRGRLLPELPAGRWHTEGWVGAILRGSDLAAAPAGRPAGQVEMARGFLRAAVQASQALLDGR